MTSVAWPVAAEWDLWFTGKEEEAIDMWIADECHWQVSVTHPALPPKRSVVRSYFEFGQTAYEYRGLTPYQRFKVRRRMNICRLLCDKYLGHW